MIQLLDRLNNDSDLSGNRTFISKAFELATYVSSSKRKNCITATALLEVLLRKIVSPNHC